MVLVCGSVYDIRSLNGALLLVLVISQKNTKLYPSRAIVKACVLDSERPRARIAGYLLAFLAVSTAAMAAQADRQTTSRMSAHFEASATLTTSPDASQVEMPSTVAEIEEPKHAEAADPQAARKSTCCLDQSQADADPAIAAERAHPGYQWSGGRKRAPRETGDGGAKAQSPIRKQPRKTHQAVEDRR